MLEQWKIHKAQEICDKPGCPLAAAKEYYAILELPSCLRRDLCAACFQSLEEEGQEPVYWKAFRQEKGKTGPRLDLVSLRFLFDRLAEEEEETARGLRYFVALLLLRKRVLRMVDAETEEQEQADLLVIDPKVEGMEPVALSAPANDEQGLAGIKRELLGFLDGEGRS